MKIEHEFEYDVHYTEIADEFCAHDSAYQAEAINSIGLQFKIWSHDKTRTSTYIQLLEIAEQLNENGKLFIETLCEYIDSKAGGSGEEIPFDDTLSGMSVSDNIRALEQEPRWIPVSEKLPEKNTAVLTYVSTGPSETYCLAYWNDISKGWEEWIGYELIEKDRGYKVLAWMPLPTPYERQESEVTE